MAAWTWHAVASGPELVAQAVASTIEVASPR
jgi:hypothetical protein